MAACPPQRGRQRHSETRDHARNQEEYGVELTGDDVKQIKTVGDAVDLVVSRAG
jgi:hypothetical protein